MKIPTEKERDAVLNKLREAVVLQQALWNTCIEIYKALHLDLGYVLDFVNHIAAVINDGTEFSQRDLDDLLGIGEPGRTIGGKLPAPERRQVH
jgi:hypothetical protein